jgi:hypothetical protein
MVGGGHTWLGEREEIRHVLHEDAAFKLEFGFAAFIDELFAGQFVLGFREINIFAAEENGFEEVDVVLLSHLC